MSVLGFAYVPRPENFHEVARLRLVEFVEILAQPQFVKETRSSRSVCIPPAPDAFAIALISNDQVFQSGVIETKLTLRAQGLNGSNENKVGCA